MQEKHQELAESVKHLEEGQEVFRSSQGAEILRAKKEDLDVMAKLLEEASEQLTEAIAVETGAVAILMMVG